MTSAGLCKACRTVVAPVLPQLIESATAAALQGDMTATVAVLNVYTSALASEPKP